MADTESLLDQLMGAGSIDGGDSFLKALSTNTLEDLLVHSEVPPPAVMDFTTLLAFADFFNSKVLKNWSRRFLQVQVVKDRKRALELVELYQSKHTSDFSKREGP
jgi:hypothetical protein